MINDYKKIFKGNVKLQNLLIKYLSDAVDYWKEENISFEIMLNN